MAAGELDRDALRSQAQLYLDLTEAMVLTLCDLFDTINEDAAIWAADVRTFLPAWVLE